VTNASFTSECKPQLFIYVLFQAEANIQVEPPFDQSGDSNADKSSLAEEHYTACDLDNRTEIADSVILYT
jgi:hypothetical protein